IPRTPDGKPNLSAPAPQTPDGKPDLSGVWRAENPRMFLDLSLGVEGGVIPYRSEVMNLVKARRDSSNSVVRRGEPQRELSAEGSCDAIHMGRRSEEDCPDSEAACDSH